MTYDGGIMNLKTPCNFFSIQHFVRTYMHDSKTTDSMWTYYISNDCSIIGDVYFLCWSWMQDMIGELELQTCITVSF